MAPWRADTLIALGFANFALGDLVEARQNLAIAIEDANIAGNPFTFLDVTTYIVQVFWIQGRPREALKCC